jgi:hypothetical protein
MMYQRTDYEALMTKHSKRPKKSKESGPDVGFGSAPNKEQDQFDAEQETLTKDELKTQVLALVALYKRTKGVKG